MVSNEHRYLGAKRISIELLLREVHFFTPSSLDGECERKNPFAVQSRSKSLGNGDRPWV
jgi:hypothetical protein